MRLGKYFEENHFLGAKAKILWKVENQIRDKNVDKYKEVKSKKV